MDEIFGVADFSGIEDIGRVAKHADGTDIEANQVEYATK